MPRHYLLPLGLVCGLLTLTISGCVPANRSTNSDTAGAVSKLVKKRGKITSGGIDCPVILVGTQVFKTDTFSKEVELDCEIGKLRALSNDGKYFATRVQTGRKSSLKRMIWVFNLTTGQKTCELPLPEEIGFGLLQIFNDKYVAIGSKESIQVWNAATGKLVTDYALKTKMKRLPNGLAFTDNGKYMAVGSDEGIEVVQVSNGEVLATMQLSNPDTSPFAPYQIFANVKHLKFSPDGTELAAISEPWSTNRILCWDITGKLLLNKLAPQIQDFDSVSDLQWMPDGKSWLVNNNLIDRETGRLLIAFTRDSRSNGTMHVHNQNVIFGRLNSDKKNICKVEIPWAKIEQAIAVKEVVYLAPQQAVDIRIEFGRTVGSENISETEITAWAKKRLERAGISHSPGAASYLKLRLSESKGNTLPIHIKNRGFDPRSSDTGKKMTEVKGELSVEFFAAGVGKPVWQQTVKAKSGTAFTREINEKNVHKSMLHFLRHEFSNIDMPNLIPTDDSIATLPIVFK